MISHVEGDSQLQFALLKKQPPAPNKTKVPSKCLTYFDKNYFAASRSKPNGCFSRQEKSVLIRCKFTDPRLLEEVDPFIFSTWTFQSFSKRFQTKTLQSRFRPSFPPGPTSSGRGAALRGLWGRRDGVWKPSAERWELSGLCWDEKNGFQKSKFWVFHFSLKEVMILRCFKRGLDWSPEMFSQILGPMRMRKKQIKSVWMPRTQSSRVEHWKSKRMNCEYKFFDKFAA